MWKYYHIPLHTSFLGKCYVLYVMGGIQKIKTLPIPNRIPQEKCGVIPLCRKYVLTSHIVVRVNALSAKSFLCIPKNFKFKRTLDWLALPCCILSPIMLWLSSRQITLYVIGN